MRRKTYVIFTFFYAILIFIISSIPLPFSVGEGGGDKILHIIEYSIFGFLILGCFKNRELFPILLLAFIISSLYGAFNEIYQYFVPGRIFSVYDMIANSIGSLFGILMSSNLYKKGLIR
jgi:VanZ family protein